MGAAGQQRTARPGRHEQLTEEPAQTTAEVKRASRHCKIKDLGAFAGAGVLDAQQVLRLRAVGPERVWSLSVLGCIGLSSVGVEIG